MTWQDWEDENYLNRFQMKNTNLEQETNKIVDADDSINLIHSVDLEIEYKKILLSNPGFMNAIANSYSKLDAGQNIAYVINDLVNNL